MAEAGLRMQDAGRLVRMTEGIAELLVRAPRAGMIPEFVDRRTAELEHRHASCAPEAWLERRAQLREAVSRCIGEEQIPRSAAAVRHVGEIRRPSYTIQKLVFEALPGLPVPALLYMPQHRSGPIPAVVHAPGHWMENAKLEPDLQRVNTWLARSGVAVLCYDPLGQGERRVGWHQHGQLGTLLTGFTTLGAMVTESRRALDVLADLPAIDAQRLGHIGASGGGLTGSSSRHSTSAPRPPRSSRSPTRIAARFARSADPAGTVRSASAASCPSCARSPRSDRSWRSPLRGRCCR